MLIILNQYYSILDSIQSILGHKLFSDEYSNQFSSNYIGFNFIVEGAFVQSNDPPCGFVLTNKANI